MPTQKTTPFSIALDRIETGLAGKDCTFPDGVTCEHYEGIGWDGLCEARTELEKLTNSHAALVEALENLSKDALALANCQHAGITLPPKMWSDLWNSANEARAALASAKP